LKARLCQVISIVFLGFRRDSETASRRNSEAPSWVRSGKFEKCAFVIVTCQALSDSFNAAQSYKTFSSVNYCLEQQSRAFLPFKDGSNIRLPLTSSTYLSPTCFSHKYFTIAFERDVQCRLLLKALRKLNRLVVAINAIDLTYDDDDEKHIVGIFIPIRTN
jgi:hypothetical protein